MEEVPDFFLFRSGRGNGEFEAAGRGECRYLIQDPRGGGVSRRRAQEAGRVSAANWGFWGGGGRG